MSLRRQVVEESMPTDAGQSVVAVLLMLFFFLLGVLGFAVDLTNIWCHRQAALAAADAACQAGSMDMLAQSGGESLPNMGFTPGHRKQLRQQCLRHDVYLCQCQRVQRHWHQLHSGVKLRLLDLSLFGEWRTAGAGSYPFMMVTIAENMKTYLMGLATGSSYLTMNVSSTCGIAQTLGAAPMVVLNPSVPGAFTYSGGALLDIVGGPSRGLQVNSSSATAISWSASGSINLSGGGPNGTGSNVGIVGGPSTAPTNGPSNGFNGGTTGVWQPNTLPIPDPFANVAVPSSVKNITPAAPKWVAHGTDGCEETSDATDGITGHNCYEYSPGYYPSGISVGSVTTVIFAPGVYYMNGSLTAGASATLRVAKPSGYKQTDGVMFYFLSGSFNVSGCSGCSSSTLANVNSTDLTCDGSSPPASLGMPTTISGNVLYGMCATKGTYFDAGDDTTDSVGSPGSRGLLFFEDHANTTQPVFGGSGELAFAGALYFHSNAYTDQLNISGGASSGTFILGEIIVDEVNLSGSGAVRLALSSAATTPLSKVGVFK